MNVFQQLKAFLLGTAQASHPAVVGAITAVDNASAAVAQALPVVAADAANAVIERAPPAIQATAPLLDMFIETVIGALLGNHSNPPAAISNVTASLPAYVAPADPPPQSSLPIEPATPAPLPAIPATHAAPSFPPAADPQAPAGDS